MANDIITNRDEQVQAPVPSTRRSSTGHGPGEYATQAHHQRKDKPIDVSIVIRGK